jgi:hypothetical protein
VSSDKLTAALALAKRGFRVFPLVPDGKTPAIKAWPEKATTDLSTLEKWFGSPRNYNIGIATGNGLTVIDIDCKNGRNGFESYSALAALHDIPDSYTVTTPTGGKHVYLASNEDHRNSASKLGEGVDVRGLGGFVVGPGSTIGGAFYRADQPDAHLGDAPQALFADLGSDRPAISEALARDAGRIDLDAPDAIQRATQYLIGAEPAVEGAGGDAHTFAVAAKLKDFGLTPETALDLLLEHWNPRCAPAWDADDLQRKVHNAFAYGTSPPGIASPQLDFEPVETTQAGNKLYIELFADITVDTDTRPLIEDYLDQNAFSVLYGESNTGKTFVALDIAHHIATGAPWLGRQVEQGGVLYVAAEGGKGIRKRIAALRKVRGSHKEVPLAVVPCPINLRGRNSDVGALIALMDEAALAMGIPVSLVVIDTLSRAMSGANENASEDMTAFVAAVDKIRASCAAHVLVVHHSGKDTAKGARGHSSLRAATDTELEVADNTLQVRKQRDMDYAEARGFRLQPVDVGEARNGKKITSCVVAWGAAGLDFEDIALTRDEQNYLMALQAAIEAAGDLCRGVVPLAAVVASYAELGLPSPSEKTVRRGLIALESKGAVKRAGSARGTKWSIS